MHCNWGASLTWDEASARAAFVESGGLAATNCFTGVGAAVSTGCWRLCKTSEYTARYSSLPAATGSGFVWGGYTKQGAHTGPYDKAHYACQSFSGQCHSTEGGQAQASGGNFWCGVGCGNNMRFTGGACFNGEWSSGYGSAVAWKSSGGYYCKEP